MDGNRNSSDNIVDRNSSNEDSANDHPPEKEKKKKKKPKTKTNKTTSDKSSLSATPADADTGYDGTPTTSIRAGSSTTIPTESVASICNDDDDHGDHEDTDQKRTNDTINKKKSNSKTKKKSKKNNKEKNIMSPSPAVVVSVTAASCPPSSKAVDKKDDHSTCNIKKKKKKKKKEDSDSDIDTDMADKSTNLGIPTTSIRMQSTDIESIGLDKTTITSPMESDKHNDVADDDENISKLQKICDQIVAKSQMLSFLPYLIIMVLVGVNKRLAIWLAFTVALLLSVVTFYHSTYRPQYSSWYYLDVTLVVCLLALGIAAEIVDIPPIIIQSIPTSAMLVAIAISMIIQYPFIMQHAKAKVTPEVASSPKFLKFMQILSGYWLIIMGVITACQWCGFLYITDTGPPVVASNNTAYIILGTVIPIVFSIIGSVGFKNFISYVDTRFLW